MNSLLALRRGLVYEGDIYSLRAIHPIPTLTRVSCAAISKPDIAGQTSVLFREDSFDPVTRIRRGRMYTCCPSHTPQALSQENVHNYPFGPHVGAAAGWMAESWYEPLSLGTIGHPTSLDSVQVNLGQGEFQTIWRIVGVERIATGELLFTLRATSLFGVLPPLQEYLNNKDGESVDADRAKQVQGALDKLVNAFHVQQPVPIVDVARETAKVLLTAWVGEPAIGKDLGKVIHIINENAFNITENQKHKNPKPKMVISWASQIINRLHPRGKSAEQENRADLRPVIDEDAEVSVHLIGLLLREIGWAQA